MAGPELSPEEQDKQRKEFIRNTFDTVANAYGTGSSRFFHLSGQVMADLHVLQGNERVIDIACGTGAAAIPLAKRLPQGTVTAVDFSKNMLAKAQDKAQQEALSNLDFQVHDMTAMPFAEAAYDCANCAFGLFFVEDMQTLLSHITSKIKTGGNVMISGFCGESFMPASKLTMDRLRAYGLDIPEQPFGWQRMSEPEQLHELFLAAGLQNVEITRKSLGYYTNPEGWWDIIWNAGFRGMIEQLGDKLEDFKQEHLAEVETLMDDKGLWLEIDVNYTQGTKP